MQTRGKMGPRINEMPFNNDFYVSGQQSRTNLDYFFSSQSPIQLNSIQYDYSLPEFKVQAQDEGFEDQNLLKSSFLADQQQANLGQGSIQPSSSQKNKCLPKSKLNGVGRLEFTSYCTEDQAKNTKNSAKILNISELCNYPCLLNEVKIKGKYHKNTNVPKILVRIFIKHFSSFLGKQKYQSLKHAHMEIKKKLQIRQTNNYKIQDVLQLLNAGSPKLLEAGSWNRETMSRIILQTMREQVILNNFVKGNKMSYMIAMKIYALRCRSATLVERVKIL